MLSDMIKTREQIIQYVHQDLRANALRKGCKSNNVCKQHRDIGIAVHNGMVEVIYRNFGPSFEALHNGLG